MAENKFSFIDTRSGLTELANQLRCAPWLCLDTEFMREKSYFPKLCLLQVATPEVIACIDPLALDDLDPLLDVLFDPKVTKVLHAARQDLEILYNLRGSVPGPVFDTQIAAALLYQNDQIGYANLVSRMLGVELDKAHTRADWSVRPLDEDQLRYAADDVRYLCQVYEQQRTLLREQGRLEWLQEDFEQLLDPQLYETHPDEAWRRVKDGRKLKGRQLAVLRALAAWRERLAMEKDKPRKWIVRDEVLAELARFMPESTDKMLKIRGVSSETVARWGERWNRIIAEAKQTPKDQWPTLEKRIVVTPEQETVLDAMVALVRLRANENQLSAPMLASRKTLEAFLLGDTSASVAHGWRKAIVGDDLQELLSGKLGLRVADGRLVASVIGAP